MIKTSAMLLEDLSDYQDPYGKIRRRCKEQKLFPVSRGVYETDASLSGYLFAPVIYGPSYLSFSYALSHYGLIPEAVREYTSATCCKGKKKNFSNHFGDYSYRDVPVQAYPFATRLVEENGYVYAIAIPEKALCDKLYELGPVKSLRELKVLLFDDMRIDPSAFDKLDASIVEELSEKYSSNNVRLLAKFVRRSKP